MPELQRKFHFYKLNDNHIDFVYKLKKVNDLSVTERETFRHNDRKTLIEIVKTDNEYIYGFVRWIRGSELPMLGVAGDSRSIPLRAAQDEEVAERSHFVIVPSRDHVIFESNFFGPRAKALLNGVNELYHRNYDPDADYNTWNPVIKRGAWDKLQRSKGVTLLRTTLTRSSALESPEMLDYSYGGTFAEAEDDETSEEATVILKRPKSKGGFSPADIVRRFREAAEDHFYKTAKANIINDEDKIEKLDLIADLYVAELYVTKLNEHRAVDSDDLYEKVTSYYAEKFRR